MYFTDIYEPRLNDYDRSGMLSYESLLQILENAGAHHAAIVYDKVAGNGIAWVLVDWRINISRRPKQFQKMHIKTWIRGKAPSSTVFRDFIITDDQEREFLRASAKLALVDLKAKKIIRISGELFYSYYPENDVVFDIEAPHLKEPEVFDDVYQIQLRRSDIDYNGHVHNTRYIDFALEALPEADYLANAFTQLRIIYRAAVKSDSQPEIRRVTVEGGYIFCIYADGKPHTLIELKTR